MPAYHEAVSAVHAVRVVSSRLLAAVGGQAEVVAGLGGRRGNNVLARRVQAERIAAAVGRHGAAEELVTAQLGCGAESRSRGLSL